MGQNVDKYWKKDIVDVKWVGDWIKSLKFVVEQDTFNVISAYVHLVELVEHHKVRFWEDLEA